MADPFIKIGSTASSARRHGKRSTPERVQPRCRDSVSTPGSRRSGESLRDRQPALRVVTLCGDVEARRRPPLGDQQAEVLRRPRHPLARILRTPRPRGAVGSRQLDPKRICRRGEAVDREREVAGADTDVGDRVQARGRGPFHTEGVGDVEAVRPRFHQPCGGHRRGAHRWAEPGQLVTVGDRQQRVVQPMSGGPPVGKQIGGRCGGDLFCAPVDEAARVLGSGPEHLCEAGIVVDRQQRDPVGP